MKAKQHLRRLGEGISILLVIFAVYELIQRVFERKDDTSLTYILVVLLIVVLCYIVGAIIED